MRGRGRFIGLALTPVFPLIAVRRVRLTAQQEAPSHVDDVWLAPSALFTLIAHGVLTVRRQVMSSARTRAPLRTLFPIVMLRVARSSVLPGRLGEFGRAGPVRTRRGVRTSFAPTSGFVERLFDRLRASVVRVDSGAVLA
ncbi:MAG: flippase-like domain-containing protein [Chloroflexi bacterium]|nr:flippase-like domain-containing protein [Chloroflexota bacterium]